MRFQKEKRNLPEEELDGEMNLYAAALEPLFLSSGPFGERDDQQVFIQKVIPITNKLFVRLSSTGKRYSCCSRVCGCSPCSVTVC